MSAVGIAKRSIACFFNFRVRMILHKKVKAIERLQTRKYAWQNPSPEILSSYRKLWKTAGYKADPAWLKMYGNISGNWDHRYIPETLYYIVAEPCLNNKSFSKCFSDKNLSSLFIGEFELPCILASNIEGVYYDEGFNINDFQHIKEQIFSQKEFIIKPATDSGGGKDVTLWKTEGEKLISSKGEVLTFPGLLEKYRKNFVIQKVIDQHPFYKQFNDSSVNTLRVFTYRSPVTEEVHLLHYILRVGAPGMVTDNQASGGFACGVTKDGKLSGVAVDKKGNRYNSINGIVLDKNLRLEFFDEISDTVKRAARKFYYSRLLGFDICVDKDGKIIIIEVNNQNNEINFYQMTEGPLFGEYTGEVVDWCAKNRRTFMIDYEI